MLVSIHSNVTVEVTAADYLDYQRYILQLQIGPDQIDIYRQTPEAMINLGEQIIAIGRKLASQQADPSIQASVTPG